MAEFLMPSLGADMEAATLVHWLVKAGDSVHRGQVVAEVETDKGVLEIEVFEDGVVEELVASEGQRLAVGGLLARIRGAAGATTPPVRAPERAAARPAVPTAAAAPPAERAAAPSASMPRAATHRRSSPAARVLAETSGIDLAAIEGTGPGGAVTVEDVRRAMAAPAPPAPAAAPGAGAPAAAAAPRSDAMRAAMRASIAALMARSKREIPHYYLSTDIDLRCAREWLDKENLARPVTGRLLPAALLIRAVAKAVAEVPEVNGFFTDGRFEASSSVHVGVAISLRDAGLIAPAILDAEGRSIDEVMSSLRDLVVRARSGRLRASEMSSPTITVTNLGDQGIDAVFGVIYPPQVAIVGFGRISDRPRGLPDARPTVTATLSADHRVSDGHRGALFLAAVDRLLQHPEAL